MLRHRHYDNIYPSKNIKRKLRTSISQTKDFISDLEVLLGITAKTLDRPRKFYAKHFGCAWRNRIHPHSLQKVHAIQTKCLDFDNCICSFRLGLRDFVIDE